jgi:PHD/YefM family antitoxin component YafN of YafNO toxin-antitoxin module
MSFRRNCCQASRGVDSAPVRCYPMAGAVLVEVRPSMEQISIQYILDEGGRTTGVIVPIELWEEIEAERETAYLLKSKGMKKRILEARKRADGLPFEVVREKLGV